MITLPLELENQLQNIAEIEHISPVSLVAKLLDDYLDRRENAHLTQLADEVLARNEPPLSKDDAMRMLNELVG